MKQTIAGIEYEIEKAILPEIAPAKESSQGFKTWRDRNTFANSIFRGPKETVEAAARFASAETAEIIQCQQTNTEGIWEFAISNRRRTDIVVQIMVKFNELKMIAFYDKDHESYVCYSAPGYPYATESEFVGFLEYHEESLYIDTHFPDETSFTEHINDWRTGEQMVVKYRFPYKKEWEEFNYLIRIDDSLYLIKNPGKKILNSDNERIESTQTIEDPYNVVDMQKAWRYVVHNDGYVMITGCKSKKAIISIPPRIGKIEVRHIGACAFKGFKNLKSINLPDKMISIGEQAFAECKSLTSIIIPDSVTSIDNSAFDGCVGLGDGEGFFIIKNVLYRYFGNNACPTIPDSVTRIGDRAFYDCKSITSINVPDSITGIGENAFDGCENLTSVKLPNSVKSIGRYAFYLCSNLTSISIPDSVTRIEDHTFGICSSLNCINLPYGVTRIGDSAFGYCISLTSIDIPNSVRRIGNHSLSQCDNLSEIIYHGTEAQWEKVGKTDLGIDLNKVKITYME